ncbi:MAG: hypothetical protein WC796_01210 [Candidatus Pacearchaeota archaeon]|jgi:hypothetical protein
MISGAFIIGKPIGPGMIRPFTVNDFHSLRNYCNLALLTECPIEVAYPKTLSDPKLAYQEGVLVNIWGGEGVESKQQLVAEINERLIFAAKKAEKIYSEFRQRGEDLPWKGQSDLDSQKVCWVGNSRGTTDLVYKPYMEVVKIYPYEERHIRYSKIALDLIIKTMRARKRRSREREEDNHQNNMGLVKNWTERK